MYNHTAEDHFEELLESDQNDPEIQYQIGLCYQNGQGVEQNGVQALQWLRRAAEQNHGEAQYALGQCYEAGQGVERDIKQTAYWYRRAAEQGCAGAYIWLRWG